MKKSFVYFRKISQLFRNILIPTCTYFKQGISSQLFGLYCKNFIVKHLQEFSTWIKDETNNLQIINNKRHLRLANQVRGLHSLLPRSDEYSYALLIAIDAHSFKDVELTVSAALQQTAPQLEVIVGYTAKSHLEIVNWLSQLKIERANLTISLIESPSEAMQLNQLAEKASSTYVLPLQVGDWIRADFLFRCEQLLRLKKSNSNYCVYTNEIRINKKGYPIPNRILKKPPTLSFPYHFENPVGNTLLMPLKSWKKVGGLKRAIDQQGLWEIALRLDLENNQFMGLPFKLYARQAEFNSPINQVEELIQALNAYTVKRKFNWQWQKGILSHSLRAVPQISSPANVHVIVPFKDQRELTLLAIKSVLKQEDINVFVTAVDNRSVDRKLSEELKNLGCEVIFVDEAFNYSRLNNCAVNQTRIAKTCDYLLFLNNDVELQSTALKEMVSWLQQPTLGIVGCKLNYPNGLLQHGGVEILQHTPASLVSWSHLEQFKTSEKVVKANVLNITEAVTAACALVRRRDFIEVGGFEEIWYPIAYSDTNLVVKLKKKGLKSFYTPFAVGVHRESLSRGLDNIEDFENSRWLHDLFLEETATH